jgi:hypothetical protein
MSPIGYASFVAGGRVDHRTERERRAERRGRERRDETVEPKARVERDQASPYQQDDRRVGAGIQREPERVGGGGRREVPVDDHEHGVDDEAARVARHSDRKRKPDPPLARHDRPPHHQRRRAERGQVRQVQAGEVRSCAEDERAEDVHDHERAKRADRRRDPTTAPHHFGFGAGDAPGPPPYR